MKLSAKEFGSGMDGYLLLFNFDLLIVYVIALIKEWFIYLKKNSNIFLIIFHTKNQTFFQVTILESKKKEKNCLQKVFQLQLVYCLL